MASPRRCGQRCLISRTTVTITKSLPRNCGITINAVYWACCAIRKSKKACNDWSRWLNGWNTAAHTHTPLATLWWIAGGFIESIAENDVYKNASVHALLGQIDKHLKQLSEEGNLVLNQAPPAELLKNLLYYVACAQRDSERIQELKRANDLSAALPTAADLETERQRMTGS